MCLVLVLHPQTSEFSVVFSVRFKKNIYILLNQQPQFFTPTGGFESSYIYGFVVVENLR